MTGTIDALRLILPMAKSYAAEHPVGSNAEYIRVAEEALRHASPIVQSEAIYSVKLMNVGDKVRMNAGGYDYTVYRYNQPLLILASPLTEDEAKTLCFILNHEVSALRHPSHPTGSEGWKLIADDF